MKGIEKLKELDETHVSEHGGESSLGFIYQLGVDTLIDVLENRKGRRVIFEQESGERVDAPVNWRYE